MRRVPWKSRDFELRGCFDNAPEAAKLIPALPVRIVLIEWELPGLCGVQCIQRLRAAQPSLGLMLVSEPPVERMLIERAVASGADLCWDARADIEHWLLVLELLAVLRGRRASGLSIGRNTSAAQTSLLTPREKRALLLLENGLLYKEIEERLNMKHSAFRKLQHRLYAKLRAANRMEAVRNAHRGNCGC